MKKFYTLLFLSSFICFYSRAGNPIKNQKDTTKKEGVIFSVGANMIYTSLNFFKNYQEETYYSGRGIRLMAQFGDRFRISSGIEQVRAINIVPIWYNVSNTFYDLDAHWILHFLDGHSKAYFILGASAQKWQGFYAGTHDLNGWKMHVSPNQNYTALYYGITMGMGAEIKIIGPLSLFGEFRCRISKTDVGTGLNDVLYSGGLKLNFLALKPKKNGRHHSVLKFHDKYHWF